MASKLPGKRVLVVDDESTIRNNICRVLKAEGCEVDGASDGMEALEKVANGKFDVLLMDIKMPGINGLETLKQIKAQNPDIAAVMLTGVADVEATRSAAMQAGAFACLIKPRSLDEIIQALSDAVDRKTMQGAQNE